MRALDKLTRVFICIRHFSINLLLFSVVILGSVVGFATHCIAGQSISALSAWNEEVPFCYLTGEVRSWPVLETRLSPGQSLHLSEAGDDQLVEKNGLRILISKDQRLTVDARAVDAKKKLGFFDLELALFDGDKKVATQTVRIGPGPSERPISYIADFGDDLINIFWDRENGAWREYGKSGFDQYFRRLQAQGVSRLITWLSPMPYIADPGNYDKKDWDLYAAQAGAFVETESGPNNFKMVTGAKDPWGVTSWAWARQLCKARLTPQFGKMLSDSAEEHGIKLSISFRPFEVALTKYYEIPAFDHSGDFLWWFMPMATPVVNSQTENVGFAHYRTLLGQMGHADRATLATIEIPNVDAGAAFIERFNRSKDNLRIEATNFPPLQADSLVLIREPSEKFQMRPYAQIAQKAAAHRKTLSGFSIEYDEPKKAIRITGLSVPEKYRYLIISDPTGENETVSFPKSSPAKLYAKAGNRLGRINQYWVLDRTVDKDATTRVAGVPKDGKVHSVFYATEASRKFLEKGPEKISLADNRLVVDRCEAWSVEMFDLNRPAMRDNVVSELRTILDYAAFDEIFINTRSHIALVSRVDLAFAPIGAADNPDLKRLAANPETVEQITTSFSPKEWHGYCQSPKSPYKWRFARNTQVAEGVRKLLVDLEENFPGVAIRMVTPARGETLLAVENGLESIKKEDGTPYEKSYFRNVKTSINYIGTIGEGITLTDLDGLSVEPVFFGVRVLVDKGPFDLYLQKSIADLADNRGSKSNAQQKSIFFEAHETLRIKGDQPTERFKEMVRAMLNQPEIDEVILYESAVWLYRMDLFGPEASGFDFLNEK
jgi:hypothetical protein